MGPPKGWRMEVRSDPGRGINDRKRGLPDLWERIVRRRSRRWVPTPKDCLLRLGAEPIFTLCERQGLEAVVIHRGGQPSFEEAPARDGLEIVTVFPVRLYGSRSRRHRRVWDARAAAAVADAARPLSLPP